MQTRQTVLAISISHREDEMERNPLQTHREGLQLGKGPASGEKRQLGPQAISILRLIFLIHLQAMLLSAQPRADREQRATEQRRGAKSALGGGRAALSGPSYIQGDPGRGCRQGRTEERMSRDSAQ